VTTTRLTDLAAAEGPWTALAARSDNIFCTWEWADCWWRHFGDGRELQLLAIEGPGGRPAALLPLHRERRRGVTFTRFIGHGVADQLGAVCAPSHLGIAQEELRRAGGDLLLAERLGSEHDWGGLKGHVLRSEASPVIAIGPGETWDDYLGERSANFRQQVRRRARRLATLGIRFRLAHEPGRLTADIDALIDLHAARWGAQSRAFGEPRASFHREFAAIALQRGWLRLWLAEAEGSPVAAWYGLRYEGVEYFYQSGRDPAWDSAGLGAGLLEHSIREAFVDGMREYRLLRGDERYKLRYATEARHVITIAVPLTQRGRGVTAVARSLARSPRGRALMSRAV
jgi:CelD/BcsL family acetyltransferase involved in cellulose biosynthesis